MINNITENSALVPLCEASHKGTFHVNWDSGRTLCVWTGQTLQFHA